MNSALLENLVEYDPFDDDFSGVIDAEYDPFDDVLNSDDNQYTEADFIAASAAVKLIPDDDVREMLTRGETVKSIIAADRASWNDYNNDIKTANRDFRERWEQVNDGYDIVDVAHAAGVELSDFDKTAKLLGYGKNWSEGAERRRAYKEKKTARPAKVLLSPPRKIKVKKLVTLDNLAAMEKRLLKVPSNRARPGNPRIWSKAGAVRW